MESLTNNVKDCHSSACDDNEVPNILTGRHGLASWPTNKLVTMAVMKTLVRGYWVVVPVVTVVQRYTENPDGAAVGGGRGGMGRELP